MKILTVTSGKGGVGKTTLALNIARQLNLHGFRVLVIDFDIHNKGTTGLLLDIVGENSPSVLGIVHKSLQFNLGEISGIAEVTHPLQIGDAEGLLFLPAARPREMVRWSKFVADNDQIVAFFRELIGRVAASQKIDVVVIDCYGGIDSLTVAAVGVADDTIIINEPDVVTFSGTLSLYAYLAETYEKSSRKPRIHFVINRISSRHSFSFLRSEYRKHLAELSPDDSILAYFPFDKLVVETFGDYPFFTELVPKGAFTKKIGVLVSTLWPESVFLKLAPWSVRRQRKIYQSTTETPFADPERIIRATVTLPFALTFPIAMLVLLANGVGGSLTYATIWIAFYGSVSAIGLVLAMITIFEPIQISRWLLRAAAYHRHKRAIKCEGRKVYGKLLSVAEYFRALLPSILSFALLVVLSVFAGESGLQFGMRNLTIWPGTIYGFNAENGSYDYLELNPRATVRPGSTLRSVHLSNAHLRGTSLNHVNFAGAYLDSADLSGARFNGATLSQARMRKAILWGTVLMGVNLSKADLSEVMSGQSEFAGAKLWRAKMVGSRFTGSNLISADLEGASLVDADLSGSDLSGANLKSADLRGARLVGSKLVGTDFREADLTDAQFKGVNLERARFEGNQTATGELLSYAMRSGAFLDPEERKRAKNWERKNREAEWLSHAWDSPQDLRLLPTLRSWLYRIEADQDFDSSNAEQLGKHLSRTWDLVELLIVLAQDDPHHLVEAKDRLREAKGHLGEVHSKFSAEFAQRADGLYHVLTLLICVLEDNKDPAALQAWYDWLKRNHSLDGWSWDMWNTNFPSDQYSPSQNIRLRGVQLSAKGHMAADDLMGWFAALPSNKN